MFDPKKKERNSHTFITGKLGRGGGGKRALRSYAEYWGTKIPDEYKEHQNEFFSASDASRILKDTQWDGELNNVKSI